MAEAGGVGAFEGPGYEGVLEPGDDGVVVDAERRQGSRVDGGLALYKPALKPV
jgi:hypothetical protein